MKLRNLFLSALAVMSVFSACSEKEEELGPAGITADATAIELPSSSQTVKITLTATRDWSYTVAYDSESTDKWLQLTPASGVGSNKEQIVEVTALANTGYNRTAVITFTIGLADAVINVSQVGDKGEHGALTVSEFVATEADEKTVYTVKGTASSNYSSSYNYIYISDGTKECEIYQPTNGAEWADKLKKGATITATGVHKIYTKTDGTTIEELASGEIIDVDASSVVEEDYTKAEALTVADFISKADGNTYYKLTGTVSSFNSTYCSFDLTDATGTIYVYSVDNKSDWTDKISNGGTVSLAGKYLYYSTKSQHEVVNAQILSFTAGSGSTTGDVKDPKTVSIAEFKAAEESQTQPYQLTGTVCGSINSTYGNFDLTDGKDTVYVYGLTKTNLGYGATNDKSYSSLGINSGDELTLIGFRGSYNGKIEVMYSYYVSHKAGSGSGDSGSGDSGSGDGGSTSGDASAYASNVSWTLGSNAYDKTSSGTSAQSATVNGVAVDNLLKLGTSSKAGTATITLPKGTSKVSFYGVSWKDKAATLSIQLGETVIATQDLAANNGATGNAPYTMTVTDSDHYTKSLGSALAADTTITVTTTGTNTRVILFGIKAE